MNKKGELQNCEGHLKIHIPNERIQVSIWLMKYYPASRIIREMQVNTKMRYQLVITESYCEKNKNTKYYVHTKKEKSCPSPVV